MAKEGIEIFEDFVKVNTKLKDAVEVRFKELMGM